jgi:hypothetical protein
MTLPATRPAVAAAVAAAALLLAAPLPRAAQTIDLPPRKPGLWEVTVAVEKPRRMAPITTRMCIDAATDREAMDFMLRLSKDSCQRYEMKKAGATWLIDSVCTIGPVKSAARVTIAGDFQSSVTMRVEGTTEGGFTGGTGPQPTLITQKATWKSADCGTLKPGDLGMPGGIRLNIKQLRSLPLTK